MFSRRVVAAALIGGLAHLLSAVMWFGAAQNYGSFEPEWLFMIAFRIYILPILVGLAPAELAILLWNLAGLEPPGIVSAGFVVGGLVASYLSVALLIEYLVKRTRTVLP